MFKPLNIETVWNAAVADPAFLGTVPEPRRREYRKVIERLPVTLDQDLLKEGVTVCTVVRARLNLLSDMQQHGFPHTYAQAHRGEEGVTRIERKTFRKVLARKIEMDLTEYEQAIKDPAAYRKGCGFASEESFFCGHERFALAPHVLHLYRISSLTVQQLLELQPKMLLRVLSWSSNQK